MRLQIDNLGKVAITIEKDYWDINKDYDKLTIVPVKDSLATYISRKPVPAGTVLTNKEYWIKFSSLQEEIILDYHKHLNELQNELGEHIRNLELSYQHALKKGKAYTNDNSIWIVETNEEGHVTGRHRPTLEQWQNSGLIFEAIVPFYSIEERESSVPGNVNYPSYVKSLHSFAYRDKDDSVKILNREPYTDGENNLNKCLFVDASSGKLYNRVYDEVNGVYDLEEYNNNVAISIDELDNILI